MQDANASTDGNSTAGNSTAAAPPATKVVQRERKRVIRVPLTVGGAGYAFPGLSAEQMKVCLFWALPCRPRLVRACLGTSQIVIHVGYNLKCGMRS